jgi:hypothetical protein
MGSALWSSERPEFVERVAKLAGGTTFRLPGGGHGTKADHLPDAHAIAAALAYGREGPADIGPDVAYCWVLQNDAYRHKVVPLLIEALRGHAFRSVMRYRKHAADAAWAAMIWNRAGTRPADAPPAYDRMLLVACATLERKAWDALAAAERAYRRGAVAQTGT